jgi:hypothetical protein
LNAHDIVCVPAAALGLCAKNALKPVAASGDALKSFVNPAGVMPAKTVFIAAPPTIASPDCAGASVRLNECAPPSPPASESMNPLAA